MGVAVGVVPASKAFTGFSDDIVIIVASALVVSAAIGRTGALEAAFHAVAPWLRTPRTQVLALVSTVTVLSAFVKNIGALAMLIPLALQLARKTRYSPSVSLMPMSFGALLGGLVTLVGTSPNVIVSRLREELTGKPFAMFDFAPVGSFWPGWGSRSWRSSTSCCRIASRPRAASTRRSTSRRIRRKPSSLPRARSSVRPWPRSTGASART